MPIARALISHSIPFSMHVKRFAFDCATNTKNIYINETVTLRLQPRCVKVASMASEHDRLKIRQTSFAVRFHIAHPDRAPERLARCALCWCNRMYFSTANYRSFVRR